MKILLVEDFVDIQFYLSALLEHYGYNVVVASDGQQAWSILREQADINLVLSDWMMPNMDGIQLCQLIREKLVSRYVYIILMTTRNEETALVEGMEAGADDFLVKPINIDELRVRLNAGLRVLKLEQTLAERNQTLTETNRKLLLAYQQISQDLQSAAKMQKDLLPKPRTIGGVKFEWLFYPTHNYVAGDMFNFFELGKQHLGFYQLDVSGHGISSALLSFTLYHHIANTPQQEGLLLRKVRNSYEPIPPEQVLRELNHTFQSSHYSKLYFTIIYGYIHKQTGELHLSQAGHPNPIYVSRNSGRAILCGEGGFPIGMLPHMQYDRITLHLEHGDRIFICSDGLTECTNQSNELFSEERLLELLTKFHNIALEDILDHVGLELLAWRGDASFNFEDDVTLLAIERV